MSNKQDLPNVKYTQVSTYFGRETSGSNAETWKVSLRGTPNSINAYIKFVHDFKQTITELACSKVGRALGLNIPEAYLVYVDTNAFPENVKKQSSFAGKGALLAFASASPAPNSMSFERLLSENNPMANKLFEAWKSLDDVIAFDEWIANPDRLDCNYLYSPAHNDFWLIDHGNALTGDCMPHWALDKPEIETYNTLFESVSHLKTHKEKYLMKNKADALMERAKVIDFSTLDAENYYKMIHGSADAAKISEFLEKRINHSVKLLCQKMGIPQLI
ncbi:HipA family kinase [Rheinheimera sp. 1928-s]|uniref:HipA family kinase n=1 Tax=Rheinheimera sp. 1928-s TaxID=3033803 RepID=UPI002604610E|nr:HipA family kinase [Rheinheimera sp. 1928-s]MDF3123519.1 hypothetical protein [Rheinheimera sp. 1928-s]